MVEMTPAEHAAWQATRCDQSSWGAVQRALAAATPIIAADLAERMWAAADTAAREYDGRMAPGRAARSVVHAVASIEHECYSAAKEARDAR